MVRKHNHNECLFLGVTNSKIWCGACGVTLTQALKRQGGGGIKHLREQSFLFGFEHN